MQEQLLLDEKGKKPQTVFYVRYLIWEFRKVYILGWNCKLLTDIVCRLGSMQN